jgi:hypothetical protein
LIGSDERDGLFLKIHLKLNSHTSFRISESKTNRSLTELDGIKFIFKMNDRINDDVNGILFYG